MRKVFIWNRLNIAHIDVHNVSPEEASFVVETASGRFPQKIGPRKYLVRGRTRARRALQVIFLVLEDDEVDVELLDLVERMMVEQGNEVVYVIHSRDLTDTEKRRI